MHPLSYNENCQQIDLREDHSAEPITEFAIYPNPTRAILKVAHNGNSNQSFVANLTIYNLLGESVWTKENAVLSNTYEIDLSKLSNGTFLLEIKSQEFDKTEFLKFIKID